MLTHAIFRGIKGGWLDGSYLKHAIRMHNATHKKVDHFGFYRVLAELLTSTGPHSHRGTGFLPSNGGCL